MERKTPELPLMEPMRNSMCDDGYHLFTLLEFADGSLGPEMGCLYCGKIVMPSE